MTRKSDLAFWVFMVLAGLAGATTVLNVTRTYSATPGNSEIYRQLDLFGDVLERVRSDYVEKPDDGMLIDSAINGMLSALDPHSAYLNPKSFKDMQVQTKGEFGGLGIEVTMEKGFVKVVSPIDDTPAAKAGLQANDLITHLDGEQIAGLTLEQAVEKMRGPVNTPITLTILRRGKDEPFDVKIVRDVIKINAVKSRLEGDIVYVKISTFNEQTHANLVKQVDELKKTLGGARAGSSSTCATILAACSTRRSTCRMPSSTRARSCSPRGVAEETQRANARPGDIADGKPIVVLINGGSASASEIVAGALQDHKRATVIGTRSFGKGSVQTIIPLGSNGAIRLTTARYYTPSDRSIQAKGIEPDIVVEQVLPPELQTKAPQRAPSEATLPRHLKNDGKDVKENTGSSSYVPREAEQDYAAAVRPEDAARRAVAAHAGPVRRRAPLPTPRRRRIADKGSGHHEPLEAWAVGRGPRLFSQPVANCRHREGLDP